MSDSESNDCNVGKLRKMKEKRTERREVEWNKALSLKADQKDSKSEDEIVELRVSDQKETTANEEEEQKYPTTVVTAHHYQSEEYVDYVRKKKKKEAEMALIPDIADGEIQKLEQWIEDWYKRIENYSNEVITKHIADNPHNIQHLLTFKPKDYRNLTKTGPIHFLRVIFVEFVRDAWKEVVGDNEFANVNLCGRILVFLSLFVLSFGIYVLIPFGVFLVLLSLAYPIIAIVLTYFLSGIESIHYLQLTLTSIYVFVLLLILILLPRVYKFQHANFHFYASRRNTYSTSIRTNPPRKQKFALKYLS